MAVFDVAFTGTSLTTGYASRAWQTTVRDRLQAFSQEEVRFYDLGKQSMTSAWGLANIQNVINCRPRVAVFEFSFNDTPSMTLAEATANTEAIIRAIRNGSPGTRVMMQTMNPAIGLSYMARLADYYESYRRIARAQNVGLIDNYPLWGASSSTEIPDGGHPTYAALERVLIPNVVAALRPLLTSPPT